MFVKSLMLTKHLSVTIQENESLRTALNELDVHDIEGLPVLDGERYAGIITRSFIYESFFFAKLDRDVFLDETKVKEVAREQENFLHGDEIFEHTLLELKDLPLLAVVDENKLFLGIVTRFDILEQFQSAFGMKRKGVRIAFTSVETEGRIARLAEIARHYHESIISLVTFDETDKLVRRIVMKVEKKDNINKFIHKLEESGFRVLYIHEDD